MIGLFFEVLPKNGHADRYFETAVALRPALDANGGVSFFDRYMSTKRDGVVLSYQHWIDEDHLIKWRDETRHQGAQKAGREVHFADYRIRVAPHVDAASKLGDSGERLIVVAESTQWPIAHDDHETFKSVYRDGQFVTLWEATGQRHALDIQARLGDLPGMTALRLFSVSRDYTMHSRGEAPQEW